MRKRSLLLAAFTACALLTVAAPMVAFAEHNDRGKRGGGLDVIGLTADGRLIEFDEPGDADKIGTIAGLVQDTRIVGIDYRPATGELIGLGDQGGVYAISDDNARATLKSRLTETLNGGSFGVDFNPPSIACA